MPNKPFHPNEQELVEELRGKWSVADTYYGPVQRKLKLLDAADKGELWKELRANFPNYQILPDTNHVSFVKTNILASLYTVTKNADVIPTSDRDVQVCMDLTVYLEHLWNTRNIGFYQFQAGERAALLNKGYTLVSWVDDDLKLRNVDPLKVRRDPFAADMNEAGWCVTFDSYHKSMFLSDRRYRERFRQFVKDDITAKDVDLPHYSDRPQSSGTKQEGHHDLYIWWVRHGERIDEYHVLDNKFLLYYNEDIRPRMFPLIELVCNLPGSSLIGSSEPAKIFANSLAYNMMKSIAYTAEYKNQRPPKFISSQSGLNLRAFSKHGAEADRTFIVNGDATRAVHYQQFPQTGPGVSGILIGTSEDIQVTSGVNSRYTGRNSGSIQTTGGMEQMLNRVTVIDTPKILTYENYCKDLTKLIVGYLIQFAPKRQYLQKTNVDINGKPQWEVCTIDFPQIKGLDEDNQITRMYSIQISSELPRTREQNQNWANNMMEKQMQYREQGATIDLITNEEWLRFQDIPYKEQMLERMGLQRQQTALEETAQVLHEYAEMLKQGQNPNDAMVQAAQGLEARRQGEPTPFEQQQQQTPLAGQGPISPMSGGMPKF